ncbi:MAG: hypothetical protein LAP40_26480 [Acidobacteriia bacterium]|nr:hypothetical protein [Terriglobia bacterium]
MDRYAESLLNGCGQVGRADGRIACAELDSEVQKVRCELVALAGSSFFGQQTHHAIALKIGSSLIVGGAGEAEYRSGLADWVLVHPYAAKHFVLDLYEIVGIEEIAGLEEWICYYVRMRIEGAVSLQGVALGSSRWVLGHRPNLRNLEYLV